MNAGLVQSHNFGPPKFLGRLERHVIESVKYKLKSRLKLTLNDSTCQRPPTNLSTTLEEPLGRESLLQNDFFLKYQ